MLAFADRSARNPFWIPRKSTKQSTPHAAEHLCALDALRGIAILAVIWYHAYGDKAPFQSGWWFQSFGLKGALGTWRSNGWIGVNLFFVLSGFVLYWPFLTQQRQMVGRADLWTFYVRRAKRLLPLYYLSIFLLMGVASVPSTRELVGLVTLTFNFHTDTFFPRTNWVLWSLGIEIWFSLLFPLLLLALERYSWQSVTMAVLSLSLLVRVAGILIPEVAYPGNNFLNPVKDSIFGRLDDFFVGMLVARAYLAGYGRRTTLWIISGLCVCTLAVLVVDLSIIGQLPRWTIVLYNNLFQLGAGLLILGALSMRLRFRPLELAGLMCYSVYLWHGVLLAHIVWNAQGSGKFMYLLVLPVLSWLSYRYVEFGHVKNVGALLPRPIREISANRAHDSLTAHKEDPMPLKN